jgi:transposase-like protein
MAVDRLNQCENIVPLAKELGVSRRLLYTWREKLERGEGPPATSREATLRHEVNRLKRVLAEKVLEVDLWNARQDVQKVRPARPQANLNRRRTLRGTLRILMS